MTSARQIVNQDHHPSLFLLPALSTEGTFTQFLISIAFSSFLVLIAATRAFAGPGINFVGDIITPADIPAVAKAAEYVTEKSLEASQLFGDSIQQGKSPAEVNRLATGIALGRSGSLEYQDAQRSYAGGNDPLSIAALMFEDYVKIIVDFYTGASEWKINGICSNLLSEVPYQEYYYPVASGEITSDPFRGSHLDNVVVAPTFESFIQNGPMLPIVTRDEITGFLDGYSLSETLTPYDVERVRAPTHPKSSGAQPNFNERVINSGLSIGTKGNIPTASGSASSIKGMNVSFKRGEQGESFRNLEFHRFSNLVTITKGKFPVVPLGNCHQRLRILEREAPFIHRSDNPLLFPLTRANSYQDLYLLLKRKVDKVQLSASPGHCIGHDFSQARGLIGSIGAWPFDPRFGSLSKVNPGVSGGICQLYGANSDNCLTGAGSLYPLTNRIAKSTTFEADFYTRFLRADKLTGLITKNKLPSFHREGSRRGGSRYPSKLQVLESSFGSTPPRVVQPGTWKDHWRDPASRIQTERKGTDIDIARYVEWTGMNCCPSGYFVVAGPVPEEKGRRIYKADGWN
ncbi:MAG: hypothetical protein KDD70_03195 [Bdellovibrionales bacterium]|nr:hypothetical protein [Bdellovibrionales bacterium]